MKVILAAVNVSKVTGFDMSRRKQTNYLSISALEEIMELSGEQAPRTLRKGVRGA
jgi:hypothetical protein